MTFTASYTLAQLRTLLTLTMYTMNDATTVETTSNGARALDLAFPFGY